MYARVTCLPTVSPCKAKMVWYLSSWDFRLMFSSSSSLIRTSNASTFVPTLPILKEEYLKFMPSRGGISSDLLLVQTQTDRQRYVEVLWKVDRHFLNYFSLKSRRGPVTPPASRQSATQKFSARMLEICNFRLPWYLWGWWPPTYWADCLVEMREIDQGGDQRGVGGAHIWQQLMPTSFCKLCFLRSHWTIWGHQVQLSDLSPTLRCFHSPCSPEKIAGSNSSDCCPSVNVFPSVCFQQYFHMLNFY